MQLPLKNPGTPREKSLEPGQRSDGARIGARPPAVVRQPFEMPGGGEVVSPIECAMKKLVVSFLAFPVLLVAVSVAEASWQICNRTPDEMSVAIAYDPGNGHHVSQGWYKLRACGGCKNFGDFKIKGVWYRAESKTGARVVEGDDLFCVHTSTAFKLGRPNDRGECSVKSGPGAKLLKKRFKFVRLKTKNFTSNIIGKGAKGQVCID